MVTNNKEYMAKWRADHPFQIKRYNETFKKKHPQYGSQRYYRRIAKWKVKIEARSKEFYRVRRLWINGFKFGKTCTLCGDTARLEFHHTDSRTKIFNIAHGIHRTKKDVLTEMKKCVLLCKACHCKVPTKGV